VLESNGYTVRVDAVREIGVQFQSGTTCYSITHEMVMVTVVVR
jgi:hypothetical protein